MNSGNTLLLLRFGELWLKSFQVRRRFADRLLTNISEGFKAGNIPFKLIKSHDRIFVEVSSKNLKKASSVLSRAFGLVSFSVVNEIETDKEKIEEMVVREALSCFKPDDTFAIRVRRTGAHEFRSQELERELGAAVVEKFKNKVNLTKPDKTISVEIRDNRAYIFSEKTDSLGGLPLGVEGKVAVIFQTKSEKASSAAKRNKMIFSGDYKRSIVASFLMMKRGCKIIPLFIKPRSSKKEKDAVTLLSKYDPLIKPVFIKSEKSAFKAAWKNRARAIIFPDSLTDVLSRKRPAYDKKTGIFALEPLVGFDEKKLKEAYENILEKI